MMPRRLGDGQPHRFGALLHARGDIDGISDLARSGGHGVGLHRRLLRCRTHGLADFFINGLVDVAGIIFKRR
jgi:hypothetical protein